MQLMKEGEITPGISSEEYIWRRKRLLQLLPENSLAIVASAPVKMMNDVVPYTFRQDADYNYITGCQQPGGVAVLSHKHGLCMFMPETTHNVSQMFFAPSFSESVLSKYIFIDLLILVSGFWSCDYIVRTENSKSLCC